VQGEARENAVVNGVVIGGLILLNLVVAAICFGLLSSSADWSNGWALGGAVAGFAVTFMLTFGAYSRLSTASDGRNSERRRLVDELKETRAQLESVRTDGQQKLDELRGKLIRGAPRPVDFEIEVDERQRLVIARPNEWVPKGGVIFSYRAPRDETSPDRIPAQLQVVAVPLEADPGAPFDAHAYYEEVRRSATEGASGPPVVCETVQLGSDRDDGIRSLRMIARAWVEIDLEDPSADNLRLIEYSAYRARLSAYADELLKAATGTTQSGSLDAQISFSETVERIAAELDRQFSNGTLRATDEHVLTEGAGGWEIGTKPADDASVAARPDPAVQGAAIVGGGEVDDPVSTSLDAGRQVSTRRRTAVTPVGFIRVYCAHPELGTLYLFEFLDDVVDFMRSTADFDSVMRSVRFLN